MLLMINLPKYVIPIRNTVDVNVKTFNMITIIYEAKTLIKHILCDCKIKINGTKCNLNLKCNNDKSQSECEKYHTCKKDYSCNPSTYNCENRRYSKSIVNNSVILCDEIKM